MKKLIYLAKEPDAGVREELKNISSSGKFSTQVYACESGYSEYYKTELRYNTITDEDYHSNKENHTMEFDVVIGNPPYQSPKETDKKGKGGNNSLYIDFIIKAINLAKDGGVVSLITPPAALVKTTILHKPTPTLEYMMKNGSIDSIDFTAKNHFPNVGSAICRWVFVKGKKQGPVKIKLNEFEGTYPIEDIFYLPPDSLDGKVNLTELEFNLFKKIISNNEGERIQVVRGKKNQECTMARFGYPKVRIGGDQELGFDEKFYEFFSSKTGLWLLDYVRRHDQLIYHNVLSGIMLPKGGFTLTEEESAWINNGNWVNNSKKES